MARPLIFWRVRRRTRLKMLRMVMGTPARIAGSVVRGCSTLAPK
jgi:hypothetical protein